MPDPTRTDLTPLQPEPELSGWMQPARPAPDPALPAALAAAAASIARLDEALAGHPLRPAFLHRARLEAVRRQAAVDGQLIDPWQLAAVLEGLRLRMDHALRIIDRGVVLDAVRHACDQYQWLVMPDFDQEGDIQRAEQHLAAFVRGGEAPLLAAARGLHAWLDGGGHYGGGGQAGDNIHPGGTRAPIRAALVRFWTRHKLLRTPVPLTGAAALRAETPFAPSAWLPAFLRALAAEAADGRQLLMDLERIWFAARGAVAGRRRDSHAAAAVDLLAAVPLISATSLAAGLGIAVKNAIRMLDGLVAAGVAVELTHRSKRRLFGLKGMAPLGVAVRPPYRPEPGRGRGRPPLIADEPDISPAPLPPLTPIERKQFDYSDLEASLTFAHQVTRRTHGSLARFARGQWRGNEAPTAATAVDAETESTAAAPPAQQQDDRVVRPGASAAVAESDPGHHGAGNIPLPLPADTEPLDESACRDGA